jgi:Cytochrome c554 and c-prime
MVKEDQSAAQGSRNRGSMTRRFAMATVVAVAGLCWYGVGCGPQFGDNPAGKPASRLFHDWPQDRKPLFVLLLSGQQHGYLQPCGCSEIQYGGLERRYNLIQHLKNDKDKGWNIVSVDLGDIPQERGPQQMLKYVTSMEALKHLGYTAVGVGQHECLLPLLNGLANFALNNQPNPPQVLAGNLQQRANNFPGAEDVAFAGGARGIPKIGITSVVAPSVAQVIKDPTVQFDALNKSLPALANILKAGNSSFKVLLCQGTEGEAKICAQTSPDFQVISYLSLEEEPPEKPVIAGNTMLVSVGHKGRDVGLVGVFPGKQPGGPYELYYQLMRIGPEFKTPEDKDANNPILGLLDEYAKKVKEGNYLAQYSQQKHPIQLQFPNAHYVGSEACKKCHEFAFQKWQNSKHAVAFNTLVKAKRPSLRQFDGECVVCHTIGFEYSTGYRDDKTTPNLKDVGCESCHGPGSEHAGKGPNWKNKKLLELMNPYKAPPNEMPDQKKTRMLKLNFFCQHCHDTDNDVNWNVPAVNPGEPPRRWPSIEHMNPKE